MLSTSPPPLAPAARPRWRSGTLTYSTGGLVALFCWLLWGDYAWDMRDRATNPVAQIMLRGFGAPDWLVGLLVFSLPAALSLVVVPIVCTRSDRHRGPRGRRIPFLLALTPVIALSMIGLAFSPRIGAWLDTALGAQSPGPMLCRTAAFSVAWACFEIAVVSVKALFNALIKDVVPDAVIGRFFALFRIVSLTSGILFNFYLMGHAEAHAFEIFVGLGLLYGVGFTLMCLRVKEGAYPPPPAAVRERNRLRSVAAYFRECFTSPFYLWFFAATALGLLAQGPVNTFSVFHARSVGLSDTAYGKCIALSYAISLVLSYPLGMLADRVHPLRLGLAVSGVYATLMGAAFWWADTASTFFISFLAHTVLAGTYLTATASIRQRLLPANKFGQFSSAADLVLGLCNVLMPLGLGVVVELSGRNYRYDFACGALVALSSALAYVMLFRAYKRHGGDCAFSPP